jgi:hypothetical protein
VTDSMAFRHQFTPRICLTSLFPVILYNIYVQNWTVAI